MENQKNVFDVLYENIESNLGTHNLKEVKVGVRSFEKMIYLYDEWKTSEVINSNGLHKLVELIKTKYIMKNIELFDTRSILELTEVATLLMYLIEIIDKKLKPLIGVNCNGIKIDIVKGETIKCSNITNKTLDMLKYSWNNGILIGLTDENKHRGIGKTTELVKFAHEKDVTLIVSHQSSKKYADALARNLGISVHIQYAGNSLSGTRCKNTKFIVDEGVSYDVIRELVKGGNELMGGFTSHYVKKLEIPEGNDELFYKSNYQFTMSGNRSELHLKDHEFPIKSGNLTELMTVNFNRDSMQLDVAVVINLMNDIPEPKSFTVDFKGRSLREVAEFIIEFISLFNVKHFYMSKNGIEFGIWDYLIILFEEKSIQYDKESRRIIRDVNTK